MLSKLENLESEFKEIEGRLADPEVISNQALYRDLSRKYKSLESVAKLADQYRQALVAKKEAEEIINSADSEMKEIAEEQLKDADKKLENLEAKAKLELLPKDPNDSRDCIVEVRAGAGGDEAAIFAGVIG